MKRLKRLKPFHDFVTAKRICNIVFRPVFDAASHGELGFCSFCCFEVEIFHKSMVLRAHPVHMGGWGREAKAYTLVNGITSTTTPVLLPVYS